MIKELFPGLGGIVEISSHCWCCCICTSTGGAKGDATTDKEELQMEDPQLEHPTA